MKKFLSVLLLFGLVTIIPSASGATSVFYSASDLGSGSWEYTYTVENDTLSMDIEEFTVFFDYGLYENLAVGGTPVDWDPITVEPALIFGFPEDGFYDAFALVSGIAPGSSLGGFSVSFDWLGAGTPGSQYFEVVDPWTFDLLDSGDTVMASVPEPGTLLLLGSGLVGLVGLRKRLDLTK